MPPNSYKAEVKAAPTHEREAAWSSALLLGVFLSLQTELGYSQR